MLCCVRPVCPSCILSEFNMGVYENRSPILDPQVAPIRYLNLGNRRMRHSFARNEGGGGGGRLPQAEGASPFGGRYCHWDRACRTLAGSWALKVESSQTLQVASSEPGPPPPPQSWEFDAGVFLASEGAIFS